MRIKNTAVLFLGLASVLCEAKPHLIRSEGKLNRDGIQYRKFDHHFFFHQSEMTYHYLLNPENQLVKKKWGDFELGLRHGRIQNGSWCMWNFFSCYMPDKKDLTNQEPAEKVSLLSTASGVHAEIVWPELTLKMVQLESAREWMFMEVIVKETPSLLRLRAWPGGAKWKVSDGGIRRLMTLSQDVTIPAKPMEYSGISGGMALYNRNYSERNGNFLVFEPGKYEKTTARAVNMVQLDFVPKAGEKVFHFALGYFLNEDPQETCGRFLKERLPNIVTLLSQVQWRPEADLSDFLRNTEVIEKMLVQADLPPKQKAAFQTELRQCKERFNAAEKKRDIPSAYHEIEIAGQLRTRIGQEAVKAFR